MRNIRFVAVLVWSLAIVFSSGAHATWWKHDSSRGGHSSSYNSGYSYYSHKKPSHEKKWYGNSYGLSSPNSRSYYYRGCQSTYAYSSYNYIYTPYWSYGGYHNGHDDGGEGWPNDDDDQTGGLAEQQCEIYPIGISETDIEGLQSGSWFKVETGTGPGNIGWMSWSGANDANTLANSLTPPGTVESYQDPINSSDTTLDPQSWVKGLSGIKKAKSVRTALNSLVGKTITVPVWNSIEGQGSQLRYQVQSFAEVMLKGYNLKGKKGYFKFSYIGEGDCGTTSPVNEVPVAIEQNISTDEDTHLEITLTGTDADGDSLTYSLGSPPSNGVLTGTAPDLSYAPNVNFNGTDSFTFIVNDGALDSTTATVRITVSPLNDVPVAIAQVVTTVEDRAIDVLLTGSDVDEDSLTYAIDSQPNNGVLSGTAPKVTYTPNANFHGTDSFKFKVNDGAIDSTSVIFDITVTPSNDAPAAQVLHITTAEDQPLSITLNGFDVDGDLLGFALVSQTPKGVLSGTAPNLVYTPNANFNGSDSFLYTVTDRAVTSAPALVSITVTAVNDAPLADAQAVTTAEDTVVEITLSGSDLDEDSLSYTLQTQPANGIINGIPPNLSYTPNADFNGSDSFTFTTNDGEVDSAIAAVSITVSPINDAPVVIIEPIATNEDEVASGSVNASDVDGDNLAYALTASPALGTLVLSSDGSYTYTPNENANGIDSFTVSVNDGSTTVVANYSITVTAVNDAPVANAQSVTANEDQPLVITLTGSDLDGDALTYAIATQPANGILAGAVPNVTYTPGANYNGQDSFTFTVNDGAVNSAIVTVSITVNSVNDAPVVTVAPIVTNEDEAVTGQFDATDPDGGALTYTLLTSPSLGSLVVNNDGSYSYTPNENVNGADQFTLRVSDGVSSTLALYDISIIAVNDAPVANGGSYSTESGQALDITFSGTDIEGDNLNYAITNMPENGTLAGIKPNLSYTPNAQFVGEDRIAFTVSDGIATSAPVNINISVIQSNTAPSITSTPVAQGRVGEEYSYAVVAVDDENDSLEYSLVGAAQGLSINAQSGLINGIPVTAGAYELTVRVNDGRGGSSQQNYQLIVIGDGNVAGAGQEYWTMFFPNFRGAIGPGSLRLHIQGDPGTAVIARIPALFVEQQYTIDASGVQVVTFPGHFSQLPRPESHTSSVYSVQITTNQQVSVSQYNHRSGTSDGTRLIPVSGLGRDYHIANYPGSDGPLFGIVATEDQTQVQVSNHAGVEVFTTTLDAGKAFQKIGGQSGWQVKADKPVAVLAGNKAVEIKEAAREFIVEQMPPVNQWGNEYIYVPYSSRIAGNVVRIHAQYDNTRVYYNGQLAVQLDERQFHHDNLDQATVITANQPVMVVQYANGGEYDRQQGGESDYGDPNMLVLQPVTQYTTSHRVHMPVAAVATAYPDSDRYFISLIVKQGGQGEVQLNGQTVASGAWSQVANTDYYQAQIELQDTSIGGPVHHINSTQPVGVYSYLFAYHEGLAQWADVETIVYTDAKTLNIMPSQSAPQVGTEQCLDLQALDAQFQPVPHQHIRIEHQLGDQARYGMGVTQPDGETRYCYTQANTGSEILTLRIGNITEIRNVSWSAHSGSDTTSPVIKSIPVLKARSGRVYKYQVQAADPNGGALQYHLIQAPEGMTIDNNGLIQWLEPTSIDNNYLRQLPKVVIEVEDEEGQRSQQAYILNVQAMVVDSISSAPYTMISGRDNSLPLRLSKRDNRTIGYGPHRVLKGPAGLRATFFGGVVWSNPPSSAEGQIFDVEVEYGFKGERPDIVDFKVKVIANAPPVISGIPDQLEVISGHSLSQTLTLSDAQGDTIRFVMENVPEGMRQSATLRINQKRLYWDPTDAQVGEHLITLVADDGFGGVTKKVITITVVQNQSPIFTSSAPEVINIKSGYQYEYTFTGTDPDGDLVKFSLANKPAGSQSYQSPNGRFTYTPGANDSGPQNFTINVYDGFGGSSQLSFTLNVIANRPPQFTSVPPSNAPTNHAYLYEPTWSDADGHSANISYVSGPTWLSYNTYYKELRTNTTLNSTHIGAHTVVMRVTDSLGAYQEQSYTLNVTQDQAPVFTSAPITELPVNVQNIYVMQAVDPEGDSIRYSIISGPTGMQVVFPDKLYWTPNSGQFGEHAVVIQALDSHGQSSTQSFTLNVVDPNNQPPVITSTPIQYGRVGQLYHYDVDAIDPDAGNTLSYSLSSTISGMAIDTASGLISWTPSETGVFRIEYFVSDGRGGTVGEYYDLRVVEASQQISGSISVSPQYVNANEAVSFRVQPETNEGVVTISASVDGNPVVLDSSHLGSYSSDVVGEHVISATLVDALDTVIVTKSFYVIDPNDVDDPVVSLSTPANGDVITAPTDIVGTVSDDYLVSWKLGYQRANGKNDYTELASGTASVVDSALANLDPSVLLNGQYEIILQGVDQQGVSISVVHQVTIEGQLKVGQFSFSIEDLNVPLLGLPISITRSYDSRRRNEALDFGQGWSADYQNVLLDESSEPTIGWSQESRVVLFEDSAGDPFSFNGTCTVPTRGQRVTVTLPNGDVEAFKAIAESIQGGQQSITDPNCYLAAGRYFHVSFAAEDGTQSRLTAVQPTDLFLSNVSDGSMIDVLNAGASVYLQQYTLTTENGYVYQLDQDFGVQTITDPNGNSITYSDSGIVHSNGTSVSFTRDSEGRITAVTDPEGNGISYTYDSNGDLTSVTDRESAESTYSYYSNSDGEGLAHIIDEMFDPLGRSLLKNFYDADGRLIAQEDSDGNRTEFNHDLTGKLSVISDRLGRVTQHAYDDRGNVLTTINALGNSTSYTYDSEDNQLSVTNALGHSNSATFDSEDHQLTQTDALGNVVAFEYNSLGQETKITDARGNAFDNAYDSVGNLLSITGPQGNNTAQVINAQGLVSQRTDALGNQTAYNYDSSGNVTVETAADGSVMSYSYDSNNNKLSDSRSRTVNGSSVAEASVYEYDKQNRMTRATDALGNSSQTDYDLLGNEVAQTDAKGNVTEMAYDVYGRLTQTTYPDGSTTSKSYDAEGNLLIETDSRGNVTAFEYDKLNRVVKTTYADSSETITEYDAIGRVVAQVDANGNRVEHTYDAANRRTQTKDALNNTFSFEYDKSGNLVKEIDAKGNETVHVFDSLDRKTSTTYTNQNGEQVQTTFDALGRITAKTDEAGVSTSYSYDSMGRLLKVTDADGNETQYSYDEVGNKLTQVDAEGRTTRWEYDALGRVTKRTLPLGQSETMTYDPVGNMLTHTDFKGQTTTYVYSNMNRRTQATYADGRIEQWTYDNNGNVVTASVTENGTTETTAYEFDNRDRLVKETKPNGDELSYTYDNMSNKLSFTHKASGAATGITTSYTYDSLNRLKTTTNHKGGVTTYSYGANGNRTKVEHSNGLSTEYSYDARNRLTDLSHKAADGSVVKSFGYTLHATGRRTKITEDSGRVSDYVYDDLYRLVSESITDSVNGAHNSAWTYDKVGNRTQSIINGVTTAYTYDDNDRLTQTGGTVYTYDANGSTLTETLDADVTTYTYNAKNQLVTAQKVIGGTTKNLSYSYDIAGIRVTNTVDNVTTNYLVDHNQAYAQVVSESDGTNTIVYTFGDDLISQDRNGVLHTFHYDGLGSTRALSTVDAVISDEYNYEAFGEQVSGSGTTENSYLYAGEQRDSDLGLDYLRARYLDVSAGRFTQQDEWVGRMTSPITLNKYVYANSDSINWSDPSGRSGLASFTTASNISGILATTAIGTVSFGVGVAAGDFATNGRFHEYDVENTVCTNIPGQRSACTMEAVIDALRRYPAPKYDGSTPVFNGETRVVPFFGPVQHLVQGSSVTNVTLEGHLLAPGFVERNIEVRGHSIVVTTHGEGTGRSPFFNTWFSDPLWTSVDNQIKGHLGAY